MAKIKFDTMLDEVNCKLGNVVYSEWKGVKYARKYKKAKDANSEAQVEVRTTFSKVSSLWKPLPQAFKNAWEFHVKGKPLTGFNLFFKTNHGFIKSDTSLQLSKSTGVTAPWNMTAIISAAGDISVNFEKEADAAFVSIFVQKIGETDPLKYLVEKTDVSTATMPVVLHGFDAAGEYRVYAVASDMQMRQAKHISDSVVCEVTK